MRMRGKRKLRLWIGHAVVLAGLPVVTLAGAGAMALGQAPAGAAATCVPAGTTGLTAVKVVTASTSTLSGTTISATGCDVGIYVAPTTSGVTIKGVTVTGANDHGIFVQDASSVTIETSTVKGNGVAPTPKINENKAIELVGTSSSTVHHDTVTGNVGGGIGVADDGPTVDPGGPKPSATVPHASKTDTVSTNTVTGNYAGCGIVYAAYNKGAGISGGTISGNTVTGAPGKFGPHGPVIGGVVVAADTPGTTLSGVTVTDNTITGAGIAGVIVHSNAPGDSVSGVTVTANKLAGDDWLSTDGPPMPAAIVVGASPIPPPAGPRLSGTVVTANTISEDFYGIWVAGASSTTTSPNTITTSAGGQAVFMVPPAGSGYTMAAADGGVFTFGQAHFSGSLGGTKLTSPIVGMAPTLDQGGYWLAAANGSVDTFGDAVNFGSMAGKALDAPIVGIAATPVASAAPGATPTPAGKGYWLVGQDGGVFTFGDAHYFGSLPGIGVHVSDVVGMASTPTGHGYWLVAADGGVFGFGDAAFYGSLPGIGVHVSDVVGIAATPDGHGYWLMGADGGVFSFGDAQFYGSMGGTHLDAPVVGGAAVGVTATA